MYLIHASLAWGFLLVGAPLLIHLLNLLRQRRVEWAAMEFLLASHRKQRHWVWLRQLLLLLCRMAAMALAVAMFARVVTLDRWTRWFQAEQTHYYLLVDDSYSMQDRSGATTAFDRGVAALRRLVDAAQERDRNARFTLLRFSQTERMATRGPQDQAESPPQGAVTPRGTTATLADLSSPAAWQRLWETLQATEHAAGPVPALKLVADLVAQDQQAKSVVLVVSDFRRPSWEDSAEIPLVLKRLQQSAARLQFIRCADRQRPNLTVQAIRQTTPQAVAGVPVQLVVEVRNQGPDDVHQIPVRLLTRPLTAPRDGGFQGNSIPDQLIPRIPAGETVPVRVPVVLESAGDYVVEAALPDDALTLDNRAWHVLRVADYLPVLVIADDEAAQDAFFLQSVFQPDATTSTGYRAVIQPSAYLRQIALAELHNFVSVYLIDCPTLEPTVYAKLAEYVGEGGGLACFAGPRSDTEFWNVARQSGLAPPPNDPAIDSSPSRDTSRDASNMDQTGTSARRPAESLLDLTARRITQLPPRPTDDVPDLKPQHPVFQVLQGERNPWLPAVQVEQYLEVELPQRDADEPSSPRGTLSTAADWEIAAVLRNQAPLAITRKWGQGRVLAFLSTLGPRWNNWARQPSYVVFILSLQEYLTPPRQGADGRTVDSTWHIEYPTANYRSNFTLTYPGNDPFRDAATLSAPFHEDVVQQRYHLELPTAGRAETSITTPWRGPYQLTAVKTAGDPQVTSFALNVDPLEGDLRILEMSELEREYADFGVQIRSSDDTQSLSPSSDRAQWSHWLFIPLLVLLLVEQVLAYWTSYHPSALPT